MPRRPKIEALPHDVRAWLEKTLADRAHPGYVALSALLKERGFDISHSAVHRHDQKLQRSLAAIRASTEAARLIAEAAPDDADDRSAAVISLVQSHLFDAMLSFAESQDEEVGPGDRLKLLGQAARSIADVSRASIGHKQFARQVRERLDVLEREAGPRRLDADTLKAVKEALYGG